MKVLLLENIHPTAAEAFRDAGFDVETRAGSLSGDELADALSGVSLLGIRSNTKITADVLEAGKDLLAVGCFCIGTNQVDLDAAVDRGIGVFNAPFSNTRSVVELVLGEIISLARRLPDKTQRMHEGVWDKSAQGSHEIRGRTLGIVGYGNIGTQLSNVAEAVGLRVIFYDTADRLAHGNARRVPTLDDLLARSDFVSLHVDGRPGNAGLFGAEQFATMKPGSVFINASRGMVVDDVSLRENILSGHISGAAIDVFPVEPKAQGDVFESPLRGLDNVILTPHVGGSTQEAQEEIGYFVSKKLLGFVSGGGTALSVNLPEVAPSRPGGAFRTGYLHTSEPGVLAGINRLLADAGVNVVGQSLSTRGEHGYVLTDTDAPLSEETLSELRRAPQTVWLRSWSL
ncbi:D-3-phosphoglycerate dehydrogenase [Pseudonocardia sediminis]|uniref:D-3-phosphoglycerate dehydrogenase n=1 Tax=Pseudonocardia sediminis TaxID=1397368 RepID=A0A4Q7UR90_PSEST|nr:phosphoglycerate dehydrogenase [Pseudonocardia sediminis]RZT84215.1 D-3-phosphoglycerate dehydrogenase [Pseudonocardia sediminis]